MLKRYINTFSIFTLAQCLTFDCSSGLVRRPQGISKRQFINRSIMSI